jgi:predicted transcriptional regulator
VTQSLDSLPGATSTGQRPGKLLSTYTHAYIYMHDKKGLSSTDQAWRDETMLVALSLNKNSLRLSLLHHVASHLALRIKAPRRGAIEIPEQSRGGYGTMNAKRKIKRKSIPALLILAVLDGEFVAPPDHLNGELRGNEMLKERFKGRRSRFDILLEVLFVARNGARKTEIVYRANLNFGRIDSYLSYLADKALIEKSEPFYKTTERGNEFLREYQTLERLIFK